MFTYPWHDHLSGQRCKCSLLVIQSNPFHFCNFSRNLRRLLKLNVVNIAHQFKIRLIGSGCFKATDKLFNRRITSNFLPNLTQHGLLRCFIGLKLTAHLHKTCGVLLTHQQKLLLFIHNNSRSDRNHLHALTSNNSGSTMPHFGSGAWN